MAQADIGGKRLIGLDPDSWLRWVTQDPQVVARQIVTSEFQWISRTNDVLIQANSPAQGQFLAATEIQLRYFNQMPRRMRVYAALGEEKFEQLVYPILVNILPPGSGIQIADRYESTIFGLQARQDYRVINLWEVDVNLVFDQPLRPLLPFAPVLRGGGDETVVRHALERLRADERLNELEPLLAFFATFVLDAKLVQEIMRWDMAVLRESPWYQEILNTGVQQGMQQGMQRGLIHMYEVRFGTVPEDIREMISRIQDSARLDLLIERVVLAHTAEEFAGELDQ